jgi:hypothetical protein
MGFFDDFDRFFRTSRTSPFPQRLNGRHAAIIAHHADQFVDKRVLDIASHDGRWAFAALQAGAAHVHGVEPRSELIENAHQTFQHYGIDRAKYDFTQGDVFDFLRNGRQFDIVLCLGFYYHTSRHVELFDLMDRTGPEWIIIDTEVTPRVEETPVTANQVPRPIFGNPYKIQLIRDQVTDQQMAWPDSTTRDGYTLVGRPSRAAVSLIAGHFGYEIQQYCWAEYFARHPEAAVEMVDYDHGWRETFYCRAAGSRSSRRSP